MTMPRTLTLTIAAGALGAAASAFAQEAMYTSAATMPSPGVVVIRPKFFFSQYGFDPVEQTETTERFAVETPSIRTRGSLINAITSEAVTKLASTRAAIISVAAALVDL